MDHLISLINWGGKSSGSEGAFHHTPSQMSHTHGNHFGRLRLKQIRRIMWFRSVPTHHRSQSFGLLLRWTSPDWSTFNHHQNEKARHGFKEKMLRSSNLAESLSNCKYIGRNKELNFEDHDLSCFNLTSKQLNLLAYIGRTSDNQKSTRIMKNWVRIE